jgi:hypothetical protein
VVKKRANDLSLRDFRRFRTGSTSARILNREVKRCGSFMIGGQGIGPFIQQKFYRGKTTGPNRTMQGGGAILIRSVKGGSGPKKELQGGDLSNSIPIGVGWVTIGSIMNRKTSTAIRSIRSVGPDGADLFDDLCSMPPCGDMERRIAGIDPMRKAGLEEFFRDCRQSGGCCLRRQPPPKSRDIVGDDQLNEV